jgi:hypothetical protein
LERLCCLGFPFFEITPKLRSYSSIGLVDDDDDISSANSTGRFNFKEEKFHLSHVKMISLLPAKARFVSYTELDGERKTQSPIRTGLSKHEIHMVIKRKKSFPQGCLSLL